MRDAVQMEQFYQADNLLKLFQDKSFTLEACIWDISYLYTKDSDPDECKSLDAEFILEVLLNEFSSTRLCWVTGHRGVGKSALAALFSLYRGIKGPLRMIEKFSIISLLSSQSLIASIAGESYFNLPLCVFPLTHKLLKTESLISLLKETPTLLILDDADALSRNHLLSIAKTLDEFPKLFIILLSSIHHCLKYKGEMILKGEPLLLELHGLKESAILKLADNWSQGSTGASFSQVSKSNLNRLSSVLKYPRILSEACFTWKQDPKYLSSVVTASELMWLILIWKASFLLEVNLDFPSESKSKFFQWLSSLGERCLNFLSANDQTDISFLYSIEIGLKDHFPLSTSKFISSVFPSNFQFTPTNYMQDISLCCRPQIEFFISLYIMDQMLKKQKLSSLISKFVDPVPIVLFVAGHLVRHQESGTITIAEEKKFIKSFVHYSDSSYEDFSFLQILVTELKCIKRLVEIVIDESEYNEEWNLNVSTLQKNSVEVLLKHVSPVRLILLDDNPRKNYELPSVIEFLMKVKISLWLDSNPQFMYGCSQKMDKLLKPFLADSVVPKLDLIAGSLSSSILKDLCQAKSTQHLVLLRLKVESLKALNCVLALPASLPKLLWLEVKLDLNIGDIPIPKLHSTDVQLFDIYLKDINHSHISFLPDFLRKMHTRYTGIHLDNTSLNPEGVFSLLKELARRNISLCAESDSINKFRRWYYPNLSSIPKWKPLTEEQMMDTIGHDDRDFYSAHHVNSMEFVTALDAWNLKNYLESQESIVHFCFEASNIVFTKGLDGLVSTTFKADYKEDLEITTKMMKEQKSNSVHLDKAPEISDVY